MSDTHLFRITMGNWLANEAAKLDALARQACQTLADRVVENTPVVTGNLRGQWQPSLNEPASPESGASVASIAAVLSGLTVGDSFYMTNGTEYGPWVEWGTSKMTGRHFVRDTVATYGSIVAAEAAKLGMVSK